MKTFLIASVITLALVGCKEKETPLPSASVKIESLNSFGGGTKIGENVVLTAAHVVASSDSVKVKNEDGAIVDGRVIFVDKVHDLALVEVDVKAETVKVKCDLVKPGTEFSIYGNPLGHEFTFSWGRVSTKPKSFEKIQSAYIVDATMINGNSGGGAFDSFGRLFGVVSAIQTADLSEENPMQALTITGFGFVVDGPTICKFLDENKVHYRK